ncbi:MAG: aldo/keto reductase [Spirochaetes bacterium]|nr:MAG: aldo/keto reductase [Spirochaetota bacterium]
MQYRTMPKDSRRLSILRFGVMRLPFRAGRIDRKQSDEMLTRALDSGVNYLDTAFPYMAGQSEPYIGRFLEENHRRKDVAIATKLPHWQTRTRKEMEKMLENQLKRLRTDYIDYYLVHNLTGGSWDSLMNREILEFLDDAKRSGRILQSGFSWHGTPEDFVRVVDSRDWDFCQIQYNLLDERRQAGTDGLKYAASKGLGVVIMEPLRGGKLAVKIPEIAMKVWKERPEKSPAAWALSWVWNHPEVTVVLSGLSKTSHMEETLALASEAEPGMLGEDEVKLVERVRDAYKAAGAVGCTGCRYCLPCPFGVSIPEVFDWYNEWKTIHHTLPQKMFYLSTIGGVLSGKSGLASKCTSCGVCLEKCPQSLPIPDLMKKINKEYEGRLGKIMDGVGSLRYKLHNRGMKKNEKNSDDR